MTMVTCAVQGPGQGGTSIEYHYGQSRCPGTIIIITGKHFITFTHTWDTFFSYFYTRLWEPRLCGCLLGQRFLKQILDCQKQSVIIPQKQGGGRIAFLVNLRTGNRMLCHPLGRIHFQFREGKHIIVIIIYCSQKKIQTRLDQYLFDVRMTTVHFHTEYHCYDIESNIICSKCIYS